MMMESDMLNVVVDPGHGGMNFGACHNGLIEKDVTLLLGLELLRSFYSTGLAEMYITRYRDTTVSLGHRGRLTRDADFVLSIHVNASPVPQARGMTCYYWPGNEVGKAVAQSILDASPITLRSGLSPIPAYNDPEDSSDNWIEAPKAVLKVHVPTAVLVEVGFATNYRDREFLLSTVGRASVVSSLRQGICRALELGIKSTNINDEFPNA